jgi:hypothetical protein
LAGGGMIICPICNSGPVFAGNAMEFGMAVDIYHPCACPEPNDDAPHWADDEPRGTAEEDFHPFIASQYQGV